MAARWISETAFNAQAKSSMFLFFRPLLEFLFNIYVVPLAVVFKQQTP